ncbi:MAG: sigma-70 family RNA polymerase sigma factor [Myxococcota bacterium]|nr:sigma-70 family RNA polymerase sigma factor [Myxococcota bacterium]
MSATPPLSRAEVYEIYTTYGALMRRRCRMVLRDDALGDDAFQDAYVNLIRYGAGFRNVTAKLRWLYTMCDRCCFAIIDRRKRSTKREEQYQRPVKSSESELLIDRQLAMTALASLDDVGRKIAVFAYVDGLSQGEIGALMGWSRQTINKKLREIKAQLQAMEDNGDE